MRLTCCVFLLQGRVAQHGLDDHRCIRQSKCRLPCEDSVATQPGRWMTLARTLRITRFRKLWDRERGSYGVFPDDSPDQRRGTGDRRAV